MGDCDIIVAGGGLAGKLASVSLGSAGFEVVCCDPGADQTVSAVDNRVTALLKPSEKCLEAAGLQQKILEAGQPLSVLRIVDAGPEPPRTLASHEFASSEIGEECFGWTVLNTDLHQLLDQRIAEMPNVTQRAGISVESVITRTSSVHCRLSDGSLLPARLLVGADGRNSRIRHELGISQGPSVGSGAALSFNVQLSLPHGGVTTEIHGDGESVTVIPLPGDGNGQESSVVWLTSDNRANGLASMTDDGFLECLHDASFGFCGSLSSATRRSNWPIQCRVADRLVAERTALVGEAAHVLSPVGAQGFNASVTDISELTNAIAANPGDPGSSKVLSAYQRRRMPDLLLRMASIGALQYTVTSTSPFIQRARRRVLGRAHGNRLVRKQLMRAGMGHPPILPILPNQV